MNNPNESPARDERDDEPMESALIPSVVEAQERAAIDVAVATARRYPRTIQAFQKDLETWALHSVEVAQGCFYVLERENRRTGEKKIIVGPSVRFAELILASYRNLAVDVRLESDDGKRIVVVAVCRDMERNVAQRVPVARSVFGKYGRFSDDMVAMTTMAAAALAKRNAIVGVVPKALWLPIWEKARALVRGDVKSIEERKGTAFKAFASVGVPVERVLGYLGKASAKDVDADDLLALQVVYHEIKEGERDPSTVGASPTSTTEAGKETATAATEAVEKGRAKGKNAKAPAAPTQPTTAPASVEQPSTVAPTAPTPTAPAAKPAATVAEGAV